MDSDGADRRVHFSQTCILILDHDVVVPHHQSSGAGAAAAAILKAFNPRNFGLHFGEKRPSIQSRRSSSVENALRSPDAGVASTNAGLAIRVPPRPSLGRRPSLTASTSPTDPPRSCMKSSNEHTPTSPTQSPALPGAFGPRGISPVAHRRRRSSSSSSLPPLTITSSSPPPPAQVSIPTEIIPLRQCCLDCNAATDIVYTMGATYRISWSPAAAAKKKRDDAEEKADIAAGLKPMLQSSKWNKLLDGEEGEEDLEDDGWSNPVRGDGDDNDEVEPTGYTRPFDPLSKLDGTAHIPRSSSGSSLNRDWHPTKYYDVEDDEEDLFPLPSPGLSPGGSPLAGSPASSSTNLPTTNAQSPEKSPPVSRPHLLPTGGLGLSTIAGSGPASPRSSAASVSSAASSSRSHNSRLPSPLGNSTSPSASQDGHARALPPKSAAHLSAPSASSYRSGSPSITTSSGSSSARSGSQNMYTATFVPPPLGVKRHHAPSPLHASVRPLARAEGTGKSPLTMGGPSIVSSKTGTSKTSSARPGVDRGERKNPPHMPDYSGTQREVVIIASSKDKERGATVKEVTPSPGRTRAKSTDKQLPEIPPNDGRPPLVKLNSRNDSFSGSSDSATPIPSRSQSSTRVNTGRSALDFEDEEDEVGHLPALPEKDVAEFGEWRGEAGRSKSLSPSKTEQSLRRSGSDASSRGRHGRDSSGEAGSEGRTRSSSIRRLWKGIGNVAGGIGAAAGAVHAS